MNYESLIEILRSKRLIIGEVLKMYSVLPGELGQTFYFPEPVVITAYSIGVLKPDTIYPHKLLGSTKNDSVLFFHESHDGNIEYLVDKSESFIATGFKFHNFTGTTGNRYSVFVAGYALNKRYLDAYQ